MADEEAQYEFVTLTKVNLKAGTNVADDRLSTYLKPTNIVEPWKDTKSVVYYHPYIYNYVVEYNSGHTGYSVMVTVFMVFSIIFPFIWCVGTVIINLVQNQFWHFPQSNELWAVYSLFVANIALDSIINFLIMRGSTCKLIMNKMFIDFALITGVIGLILAPVMNAAVIHNAVQNQGTLDKRVSSILDFFCLILMTSSLVVSNKFVESIIKKLVVQKALYHVGIMKKSTVKPRENETADAARERIFKFLFAQGKEIITWTLASKEYLAELENRDDVIRFIESFVDEVDMNTTMGKHRAYLKIKMILNIIASAFFFLYANVYLGGADGNFAFVLILAFCSFFANITTAKCVKFHDECLKSLNGGEKVEYTLELGKFGNYEHVQFYFALLFNLFSVVFHLKKTGVGSF